MQAYALRVPKVKKYQIGKNIFSLDTVWFLSCLDNKIMVRRQNRRRKISSSRQTRMTPEYVSRRLVCKNLAARLARSLFRLRYNYGGVRFTFFLKIQRTKTFENVFHPKQVHRSPHIRPTYQDQER
jgi:hypothetical protein